MVCQLLGMELNSEAPIQPQWVLESIRDAPPRFTIASRVMELLAAHPLSLRRVYRVLSLSQTRGILEWMVQPLAAGIESAASWLTPAYRSAARSPSEREGSVWAIGAITGLITAFLACILPKMHVGVACVLIGLPAGMAVGAGTALVLYRNGPFLGADVFDAVLSGALAWFLGAFGVSVMFNLPNDWSLFPASGVVLLVTFGVSVVGYALLAPARSPSITEVAPAMPLPPPAIPAPRFAASSPPAVAAPPIALPPRGAAPVVEELPEFSPAAEEPAPETSAPKPPRNSKEQEISFDRDN